MAKSRSTRRNLRRTKKRSTRGGGFFSVGKKIANNTARRLEEEKRQKNRLASPAHQALVKAAINAAAKKGPGSIVVNKNGKIEA